MKMNSSKRHVDPKASRRSRRRAQMIGAGIAGLSLAVYGVGVGATSSVASWATAGTGNAATVTAGQSAPLTVSSVTGATGLLPTGSATATFQVTNPNSFPVRIATATVTGVGMSGGKTPSACNTAAKAHVSASVNTAAIGVVIPANGTSAALGVTVSMGAESDDGCQNVVSTPQINVTGTSAPAS